jgi:hypothetical protein
MRGTLNPGDKQAIIHAVSHESRRDVAQAQQASGFNFTKSRHFCNSLG